MSTATETIESLVKQEYKYGFVTDVEYRVGPARLERGHHPPDFGQEKGAAMADGLAAQGVPPLAHHDRSRTGSSSNIRP